MGCLPVSHADRKPFVSGGGAVSRRAARDSASSDKVVASCGTSLTPEQVELLGRHTRDIVVSYDADSAG